MSNKSKIIISSPDHGVNLKNYITGFVASICLTLMAYVAVTQEAFSRNALIGFITALAMLQFIVQLVFFMHLGRETRPRWKFYSFIFMIVIVLILVVGSLWIMNNLDYRMTPEDTSNYLRTQEGF